MIGTDIERPRNRPDEHHFIIQEYEAIVECLQDNLKSCKEEQIRLRNEVETLRNENKTVAEVTRAAFSHSNNSECPRNVEDKELVENLKKQISLIQLEKDSMFQLWQMALKTVDTLEQEIKTSHSDIVAHSYYEKQVDHVKETYSEAIKALESKLIQAKENFIKHQALWESCRDRVEILSQEKLELEKKLINSQNDTLMKDETYKRMVENLNSNLEEIKRELEASKAAQVKLENELVQTRGLATRIASKDQESKAKVAEAIELVETAIKEKELVHQRESLLIEEKAKIEAQLANIAEDFASRMEKELSECKENYEKNCKKYCLEIKELKSELREKVTLFDRVQSECRSLEEEILKMKMGSEDFLNRSSSKVVELEKKLKESEEKLMNSEEINRRKFEEKIKLAESKINELEEKLSSANDRLRKNQLFGSREMEDRIREADDRVKEIMERYSGVEKRLTRALDERENVASELRNLQITFDREMLRRDNERRLLESRIKEMQQDLRNANDMAEKAGTRANQFNLQINNLQKELDERRSQMINKNDDIEVILKEKTSNFNRLREKYEESIEELSKHVKIHQTLSAKWKEEAQFLADKFQARYKDLRMKALKVQKENEKLKDELNTCQQQVARCRAQVMQSFESDFR